MRSLIARNSFKAVLNASLDDIRIELNNPDSLVWVDLNDDSLESTHQILAEVFKFHPLSIDDALIESHIPKIDDWENYLYLSLIAVDPENALDDINKSLELDVFIGKNYIVTYHPEEIKAVDVVWGYFQRDERRLIKGSNYLLYHIVDEVANGYMALIDRMDLEVETIEDEVMEKPDNRLLERIFSIKRTLLNLRRIVAPQREVLNKMSRGDFEVIGQKERMYYRDVYDHLVRVHDITESLRDLVSGVLDTYLSVVNNRLNDIMKTLTIITTLFMPLSFLTGFFGMNFFGPSGSLDILTGNPAFYGMAVIFLLLPLGMFIWMRNRNWM